MIYLRSVRKDSLADSVQIALLSDFDQPTVELRFNSQSLFQAIDLGIAERLNPDQFVANLLLQFVNRVLKRMHASQSLKTG